MATSPTEGPTLDELDLPAGELEFLAACQPLSTKGDQWWMTMARCWAANSRDTRFPSGCVAIRESRQVAAACDRFPGHSIDSQARRHHAATRAGMRLSAPLALVCDAARHGTSLKGSRVYLYPCLEDAHSAAALIDTGCNAIITLPLPVPARLIDEMRMVAQLASENGVLLQTVDLGGDPGTFDA